MKTRRHYHLIRGRPQELRRNMTAPERLLWSHLRAGRLGVRFRRQHPIGPYIVDFYCPAARLVIEIDGEVHNTPDNRRADEARERWLQARGLHILRVNNDALGHNLPEVLDRIRRLLPNR
jgi:very-short-patch-repair endonuclease